MRSNAGFTLIEALIVMIGLAILAVLAIPALAATFEATHSSSARSEFYDTWMSAVRHAVVTGTEVVICPGDAGGCREDIDWSKGWIAFADLDGNRSRGQSETLLHQASSLHGKVHLRGTVGRTRLIVQPFGSNAGSNVTLTLCDRRGPARATTIVLANDGRMRLGTPTSAAARACMAPT